ncbi:MAG: hypothetical protein DSZ28_08865 [Thiothrix sp.]|nr:MAG: hypothetical protein DSZ28_08865 [Thiothrix sp.]
MGVELAVYRQRVGTFAACYRPKLRREVLHHPEYEGIELSDRTFFNALALIVMYACGLIWMCLLSPNCVCALQMAMMGQHAGYCFREKGGNLSVAYDVDRSTILMLGGDIELNPGPVEWEEINEALKKLNESLFERMTAELTKQIGQVREEMINMTSEMKDIKQEMLSINNKLQAHEGLIEHISDTTHELSRRMEELEQHVEEQETRSRRDNVILHGVPEETHETPEKSEEKFIETVNAVLAVPLQKADIVRAHRIGKQQEGRDRPLIARLAKSSHKHAVLQKRQELRQKHVGVSGDLTVQQRKKIQEARDDGKFAYYKGGVLHVEERHSRPDSGSQRRFTRSQAKVGNHPTE